jgi:hypothetical protein
MEHAMLPPVTAVSNIGSIAPFREAAIAAEISAGAGIAPDSALALSLAVSSGVEGKLSMLLINARARMIDSLFAVIDAVSQSLVLPQDPGEGNAAYALRLADTMTELPPKQMADLQRQLTSQGQAAPLSLVAAALHDPGGPEAAQLVAYLEVVRYKDKDLATRSVVASYGQNDGSSEPETAAPRTPISTVAPVTTPATAAAALPQPGLAAGKLPAPPAGTAPLELAEPPAVDAEAEPAASTTPPAQDAAAEPPAQLPSSPSPLATTTRSLTTLANPLAEHLATIAPNVAAEAANVPVEQPTADEAVPRVVLQIRSDLQEGLKAVFDRLVIVTGAELLQTMAEAEPQADKAIAQALIADMIDGTELAALPLNENVNAAQRAALASSSASVFSDIDTTSENVEVDPYVQNQQMADTPEAIQDAGRQQPATFVPGLAVGFVTTPFAPAEDVVTNKDQMRIDRVDAVDDDEHEDPDHGQQHAGAEDEPETPAEEALEMLAGEPDGSAASAEEQPTAGDGQLESRSNLLALPRPAAAEPLPHAGYDLYQRMGA